MGLLAMTSKWAGLSKSSVMSASLPVVEKLSLRVWRVLGLNPGLFTLQGTNTYLVGTGEKRVLIDTGEANREDYTDLLTETLHKLKATISQIVITHWHHDHLGGLPGVLDKVCKGIERPKVYKLPLPSDHSNFIYPLRGEGNQEVTESSFKDEKVLTYVKDGDVIRTQGATLQVVATPGHTRDHMSLWLQEENAIFTGDCVLGEGSAVFEELSSYMASLEKLLTLGPSVLYPGHGPKVENGHDTIRQYIAHRMAREMQVVDFLQTSTEPVTSLQIVAHIYKDVDQKLWLGAENNVMLHLHKLEKEGRVQVLTSTADKKHILWKLTNKL